jgi:hypothetical protein
MSMSTGREIRLVENPDGWWTARDVEVGVTTQGETRTEALDALDDVVATLADDVVEARQADRGLGTQLRGQAADIDADPVEAVRDIRERRVDRMANDHSHE